MKSIIRKVLNEYQKTSVNELSLSSDIVSELIDLISQNPFVIKEIGFKNMKQVMNYIEECDYRDFTDLRDEVNHLIKSKEDSEKK